MRIGLRRVVCTILAVASLHTCAANLAREATYNIDEGKAATVFAESPANEESYNATFAESSAEGETSHSAFEEDSIISEASFTALAASAAALKMASTCS